MALKGKKKKEAIKYLIGMRHVINGARGKEAFFRVMVHWGRQGLKNMQQVAEANFTPVKLDPTAPSSIEEVDIVMKWPIFKDKK